MAFNQVGHGIKRAFKEMLMGIIPSIMTSVLAISFDSFGTSSNWILLVVSLTTNLVLYQKMKYWKTHYLMGWFVGNSILFSTGLIGNYFDFLMMSMAPTYLMLKRNNSFN